MNVTCTVEFTTDIFSRPINCALSLGIKQEHNTREQDTVSVVTYSDIACVVREPMVAHSASEDMSLQVFRASKLTRLQESESAHFCARILPIARLSFESRLEIT